MSSGCSLIRSPGCRNDRGTQLGASRSKPPVRLSSASTSERVWDLMSLSEVMVFMFSCLVVLLVSFNSQPDKIRPGWQARMSQHRPCRALPTGPGSVKVVGG